MLPNCKPLGIRHRHLPYHTIPYLTNLKYQTIASTSECDLARSSSRHNNNNTNMHDTSPSFLF